MTTPPEATAPEMPEYAWFQLNTVWNVLEQTIGETENSVKYIRADLIKPEPVADLEALKRAIEAGADEPDWDASWVMDIIKDHLRPAFHYVEKK